MSHQSNVSKRRTEITRPSRKLTATSEDFGDGDLDDDTDLVAARRFVIARRGKNEQQGRSNRRNRQHFPVRDVTTQRLSNLPHWSLQRDEG